ncbi:MAG: N-6 DNA methylase [Deinococcota bacterium]|nr:N-6 DNA methylase [Deinococcota bacterium]
MALADFLAHLQTLLVRAEELKTGRLGAKPEASTQDGLLTPFLEALGYGPDERRPEAGIRSLTLTKEWVDYFLLPAKRKAPWLMVEAKSFWDRNIWQTNKDQVLDYLRNYALDVGADTPVPWLILSNFREWHVLRLSDREPFWTFSAEDLADPDFAAEVYERLARENIARDRLLAYYSEHRRQTLGEQFLRDLKLWRVILANGIRQAQPELTLDEIRQASHLILLRFLFIRLLENYGQEPYYVLGRLYKSWEDAFRSKPFIEQLRSKFDDTWASYNTELFAANPFVDGLHIPNEHLEMLVLLSPVPDPSLVPLTEGQILGFRSVYNYDFTTLTQDILGVAYEQFLAHELVESGGVIQVLDNQETRKREGVFYTPEYIVRHIVRRVLEPQVKPHLDGALERLAAGDYEAASLAANRILEVRVADPACGSGSFLLGAFDYLSEALERYNQKVDEMEAKVRTGKLNERVNMFDAGESILKQERPKRIDYPHERVLVDCIYGVDLDPQAVGLAKLSLWTKLLRTHPGQYGRRGSAHAQLPALTLNLRSGNSLVDAQSPHPPLARGAAERSDSRGDYTETLKKAARFARGAKDVSMAAEGRKEALDSLETTLQGVNEALLPNLLPFFAGDETLRRAAAEAGLEDDDATVRAVRHYLITGNKPRALADTPDRTLAEVLEALRAQAEALEEARKKRPFNWSAEFPDVFDPALPEGARGFTAVIGNPPYFNVDATFGRGAPELDWLRAAYPEVYADKTDILFYFFVRGYQVLRPGGELGFIVSRSFLQGDKSKGLRRFLAERTTLLGSLDFLGHKVFAAGIATAIVHWRKGEAPEGHALAATYVMDEGAVRRQLERGHYPVDGVVRVEALQADLGEDRWVLSPYRELFARIDGAGRVLREVVRLGKGMETGENDVFVVNQEKIRRFGLPEAHLKRRASNDNLHRYGAVDGGERVLWVEDWDFAALPKPVRVYLEANREVLEGRAAYRRGNCEWYRFTWPLHADVHFAAKIMAPYRAHGNVFAVDNSGAWLGLTNTTQVFCKGSPIDVYALCALLNSVVLEFRYRALGGLGKLTGKGMFEYFENQVGDLPIPDLSEEDEARLGELGRRAQALFRRRYALMEAYRRVLYGQVQQDTAFAAYHDLAGDYGQLVRATSPNPNRLGHLLGLRAEATERGYTLWGEVTEEEDWREGEREWSVLAEVEVTHEALRRMLLFRAHDLSEFDEGFRRRQRFTRGKGENLLGAALRALSAPMYDTDAIRNLRIVENLEARVMSEAPGETLAAVMLEAKAAEVAIDELAYRVYGVLEHRADIEEALKTVL